MVICLGINGKKTLALKKEWLNITINEWKRTLLDKPNRFWFTIILVIHRFSGGSWESSEEIKFNFFWNDIIRSF